MVAEHKSAVPKLDQISDTDFINLIGIIRTGETRNNQVFNNNRGIRRPRSEFVQIVINPFAIA